GSAWNGVRGAKFITFPFETFEEAVLSRLREVKPADILPQDDGAADKVLTLDRKLADIMDRIGTIKAAMMESDDLPSLVEVLRSLERKRAAVNDELTEAQHTVASPLSSAWGDARSLLDAIQDKETKIRLRAALHRICDGIWCLFVSR